MRGIEMGRETAKYIGNTAKEVSGVGAAHRIHKDLEELRHNKVGDWVMASVVGAENLANPLYASFSVKYETNIGGRIGGLLIDTIANVFFAGYASTGHLPEAFIAKFGYNTLVQVAPDVAKLAKRRVFQRAR